LIAFGRGAAPDDDERSDEGTISQVSAINKGNTLCSNHKVPRNNIYGFRIDEQFIRAGVNLRVLALNSI
jgi:hypothetical protein